MSMRIILLRVLIASWAIPLSWVMLFPVIALLSGVQIAIEETIKYNRDVWNGI